MRSRTTFAVATATVLALVLIVAGCGGKKTYGEPVSVAEKTSVTDILKDPSAWKGKTVRVEGKVDEVCQTMGCWFYLVDGSGRIMIDLEMRPDSYSVPKGAAGKRAVVQGRVKYDGTSPVRIVGVGNTFE